MSSAERRSRSTKVAALAPRLRASRPLMPVPAKMSKNGRPGTALPRMLNRASRTICGVGRRPGWTTTVNLRPRKLPATMRSCVRCMRVFYAPRGLAAARGSATAVARLHAAQYHQPQLRLVEIAQHRQVVCLRPGDNLFRQQHLGERRPLDSLVQPHVTQFGGPFRLQDLFRRQRQLLLAADAGFASLADAESQFRSRVLVRKLRLG